MPHIESTTYIINAPARKMARDIREALKNNCLYVYAYPSEVLAHDPKATYRIINVRVHKGKLEGKSLTMGYWFAIQGWEQR